MADAWKPSETRQERLMKAVSTATRASLDGRVIQSRPVPERERRKGLVDTRQVPFSRSGELAGTEASPKYTVLNSGLILRATGRAETSSGSVTFKVYHNGTLIISLTITNSTTTILEDLDISVDRGDRIWVTSTTTGTVSDAVVQVDIMEER